MEILQELWTGETIHDETRTTCEYVINLRDTLETIMKLAQDNIAGAQRKHKFCYDKRTKSKDIRPGDRVLIMQPNKQNLLQTQSTGPYVVLEKVNLNNYEVQIKQRVKIYHAKMLKKFIERETEKGYLQVASFIDYEDTAKDEPG